MTNWDKVANGMWKAILGHVNDLRSQGETLQTIAKKIGVNSPSVIRSWIIGERSAEGTSFVLLMSYLENCGLDYKDFFPQDPGIKASTLAKAHARVAELEEQVHRLEIFRYKWEGYLESLSAQSGQASKKMAG